MYKPCPKCGEKVEGVDLGDNGTFLNFDCECGHSWGQECAEDFMEQAERWAELASDEERSTRHG